MKRFYAMAFAAALSSMLASCGTYTPDLQEFWGTAGDAGDKEGAIVEQIRCELQRAARVVVKRDMDFAAAGQGRQLAWFDKDWGADILIVFTIDEKSSLTPSVGFNDPLPNAVRRFVGGATTSTPQSYSLGFGGQLSSEGYRQDKIHIFYKIADLVGPEKELAPARDILTQSCLPRKVPNASLFIATDLKVYEWLQSIANRQLTGQADFSVQDPFATSGVLSHEVRFEIVSSGNVNPTWKLVLVSANTGSNPLFNASRDRTQDLTITLGPSKKGSLSTPQGRDSALTSEFNATLRSFIPQAPY